MPSSRPESQAAILFLADLESINAEAYHFLISLLGPDETRRYENLTREERRRQFLLGRFLLKKGLSGILGISPLEISVAERSGNTPLITIPNSAKGIQSGIPYFSISHSGKWVACTISCHTPVGLDIETDKKKRNFMEIARVAFDQGEYDWLQKQPEAERLPSFYRIWTRKEALYKLMSSQNETGTPVSLWSTNVLDPTLPGRYFKTLPHDDLFISVCSRECLNNAELMPLDCSSSEKIEACLDSISC